jgi:hypothetical protein
MDSEEDQARLHFRSPPNTFGICWEHGSKRDRGHRKVRCDVERGTAAALLCILATRRLHKDQTSTKAWLLNNSSASRCKL